MDPGLCVHVAASGRGHSRRCGEARGSRASRLYVEAEGGWRMSREDVKATGYQAGRVYCPAALCRLPFLV